MAGLTKCATTCNLSFSPCGALHVLVVVGVEVPGGGALRYRMATHCQTTTRSGSGERQNIGAINCFEGQKGGAVNFKLSTL